MCSFAFPLRTTIVSEMLPCQRRQASPTTSTITCTMTKDHGGVGGVDNGVEAAHRHDNGHGALGHLAGTLHKCSGGDQAASLGTATMEATATTTTATATVTIIMTAT